jgi:hypothetical protein
MHDRIPLLTRSGLFPAWLRWGFTTRHGGVSTGPFASLNFGWDVGDDRSAVRENHRRLAATLGYDPDMLATVYQVHGRRVHVVRTPEEGRALRGRHADGIVLAPGTKSRQPTANSRPLAALVRVADCCPVVVASLAHPVAAVLHCGWRSQIAGLVAEGVATIARVVRQERPALAAAIGPCIGPLAYEVGEEVAGPFAERVSRDVVLRRPGWPRPHVDLQASARLLLVRAGIPESRIVVFRRCTFREPDDFHSFRREGHDCGRQVGVISVGGRQ